jgi:hypothetical protein
VGTSAASRIQEATAGVAQQVEPVTKLGHRHPLASLAVVLGMGYWLAESFRRQAEAKAAA